MGAPVLTHPHTLLESGSTLEQTMSLDFSAAATTAASRRTCISTGPSLRKPIYAAPDFLKRAIRISKMNRNE